VFQDWKPTLVLPGAKLEMMWKTTGAGALVSLIAFALVIWACGRFLMPLIVWLGSRPLLVDALVLTLVIVVSIATPILRHWAHHRKTQAPRHA